MNFALTEIGKIRSPFKQKFAIPRQPGLVKFARGQLELFAPFNETETLIGLEQFSHIWIVFIFHENLERGWSAQVRPPRLGGNKKLGVFATRSTYRPNPIGLSVVEYLGFEQTDGRLLLNIAGLDLLDETPVIDIKPYVPYADNVSHANAGYASLAPNPTMTVKFEAEAEHQCQQHEVNYPNLKEFISALVAQDPRPAYKKSEARVQDYAVFLYQFNIKWRVENNVSWITSVLPTSIPSSKD